MGNTNLTAKPSDARVFHSKDRWELELFGRQNVILPTAWTQAGFSEHAKINITEYLYLTQNSPNAGLWRIMNTQHRWARELDSRIKSHISAQTSPLTKGRVSHLLNQNKSFPTWYRKTEVALNSAVGGGFDILMRDFFADLQAQNSVSKYFSTKQPVVYSQSQTVTAVITAGEALREGLGTDFEYEEVTSSGWTLLNIAGESIFVKSIPVRSGGLTQYILAAAERVKGEPKISLVSLQDEDIPQSQMQQAVQNLINPSFQDVAIAIEGTVSPSIQLQSFTTTKKKRLVSADSKWSRPSVETTSVALGADSSAALALSGYKAPSRVRSKSFYSSSFSLKNRKGEVLVLQQGRLQLRPGSAGAGGAKLNWKNKEHLEVNQRQLLMYDLSLTSEKKNAVGIHFEQKSRGVVVIRHSQTMNILSSVEMNWVRSNESAYFHGWSIF